jgi:hypothetical protein
MLHRQLHATNNALIDPERNKHTQKKRENKRGEGVFTGLLVL